MYLTYCRAGIRRISTFVGSSVVLHPAGECFSRVVTSSSTAKDCRCQTYARRLKPGSFSCHTCCGSGPRRTPQFFRWLQASGTEDLLLRCKMPVKKTFNKVRPYQQSCALKQGTRGMLLLGKYACYLSKLKLIIIISIAENEKTSFHFQQLKFRL